MIRNLLLTVSFFLLMGLTPYAQDTTRLLDFDEASKRLKQKEQELTVKEQELKDRESRLDALEKDLIRREGELAKVRDELSEKMTTFTAQSEKELATVAKLYSSTQPKAAASVMIKMDVEYTSKILSRISAMTAGKIMSEIAKQNPAYATELTKYMSGNKKIDSLGGVN